MTRKPHPKHRPGKAAGRPPRRVRPARLREPKEPRKPDKAGPPEEDPVVTAILEALADAATLSPRDIATRIAADRLGPGAGREAWRRYFTAVKHQALHLARAGRIEIVRKGAVVAPDDVKGIVRYRRARGGAQGG